jgi:hypothetical protein
MRRCLRLVNYPRVRQWLALPLFLIFFAIPGAVVYLLPTAIALLEGGEQRRSIIRVNLLLGWTIVGWIVAFYWAISTDDA